ncbi:unnamed protein product [Protopolystoma xenopodis]|uniref:Uncharacterized protein n=1 Tax=Protopolystoma xenopodis TaxID=117903 RepID=A0A448WLU4_9PLAT|nr:unnamed protein product [Protopolystoma xenopodis]
MLSPLGQSVARLHSGARFAVLRPVVIALSSSWPRVVAESGHLAWAQRRSASFTSLPQSVCSLCPSHTRTSLSNLHSPLFRFPCLASDTPSSGPLFCPETDPPLHPRCRPIPPLPTSGSDGNVEAIAKTIARRPPSARQADRRTSYFRRLEAGTASLVMILQ